LLLGCLGYEGQLHQAVSHLDEYAFLDMVGILATLYHVHRPGSSVPELSNPVKAAPELSSSQHLSTSLQRLYRYFATVVRYFATSR